MVPKSHRRTFISYSRINKEFALNLALELRASGFDIWLDQLDIPTGSRWDDEVEQALEACEIFMVILTPASSTSDNVKDEIGYAIDSGKRILPILLENAKVPLRLIRFQYVDFTKKSFEEGVESAKQLLRRLIEEPTIPRDEYPGAVRSRVSKEYQPREEPEDFVPSPTPDRGKPEPRRRMDTVQITGGYNMKERPVVEKQEFDAAKPEPDLAPLKGEIVRTPAAKKSRRPLLLGTAGVGFLAVVAIAVFAFLNGSGGKIPNTGEPDNNLAGKETVPSPVPLVAAVEPTKTSVPTVEPTDSPAPTKSQQLEQPTNTLEPTAVPATPTAGIQKFDTIQFEDEGDLEAWSTFIAEDRNELGKPVISNEEFSDVTLSLKDGLYFFEIGHRQTLIYSIYDSFKYDNVRVDVRVDSRNNNVSKVSLICRYSPENGWYEFRIANNGPYGIYYAKPNAQGLISYRTLADGNTRNTNAGNDINEYSMVCQGDDNLSLYVNGELVRMTSDLFKVLRMGKVGVAVTSLNGIPIRAGFDWIKISEPE